MHDEPLPDYQSNIRAPATQLPADGDSVFCVLTVSKFTQEIGNIFIHASFYNGGRGSNKNIIPSDDF